MFVHRCLFSVRLSIDNTACAYVAVTVYAVIVQLSYCCERDSSLLWNSITVVFEI